MLRIQVTEQRPEENNSEYAYRILYDNIMALTLSPGSVLNESQIADMLGVSRTPVREAILQLKQYNLVEVYPQKASVVSKISFALVKEGYFLRTSLEPTICRLAGLNLDGDTAYLLDENLKAQKEIIGQEEIDGWAFFNLDNEFHRIIYHEAKKPHIWEFSRLVTSHFDRIRFFPGIQTPENMEGNYRDHQSLYDGLVAGIDNLTEIYPRHLSTYQESLPALMAKHPDFFEV